MASITKQEGKNGISYRVRYRVNDEPRSRSFPTYKLAREFKVKVEHQVYEGSYVDSGKMTVANLLDDWLDVHKSKIELNTFIGYGFACKTIKPYIGSNLLKKLNAIDVEKMLADYNETHSGRSTLSLYQVLNLSLRFAFKARLINTNICDYVERPKVKKPVIHIIDADDIPKYINVVKDSWIYPAIALAMFCGLRREEVFALDWEHIDYDKGEVFIEFVDVVKNGQFVRKAPKNGRTRIVPLPSIVSDILKEHRKHQLETRMRAGSLHHAKCQYSGKNNNFVVTMENGKRPFPDYLYTFFKRRQISSGLKRVSFHSLRHTAASLLYSSGIDYKELSEILGHSSVQFTIDTYVHLFEADKKDSKDKINERMKELL